MNLMDISYTPAVQVSPLDSVQGAIAAAIPTECDAVAVMENGGIRGILTSRDVMLKVVLKRLDPHDLLVKDIMTKDVLTLHPETDPEKALEIMLERHFRHLPLSEDGISVCGMLSMRKLLNFIVQDQRNSLQHMEAFLNADCPGG